MFVFRPHLLEEGRDVRLIFMNERVDLTAQLFCVLRKCAYLGGDDGGVEYGAKVIILGQEFAFDDPWD